MATHITALVHRYDITAIATMGETGYCGHSDHATTHLAALSAQLTLAEHGQHLLLYSLDHTHEGTLRLTVAKQRKLGGLSTHASQMSVDTINSISDEFWQKYPKYLPLLTEETYAFYS